MVFIGAPVTLAHVSVDTSRHGDVKEAGERIHTRRGIIAAESRGGAYSLKLYLIFLITDLF